MQCRTCDSENVRKVPHTMKKKCTAILLAAGAGRRMESDIAKQYMMLCGKPVIWYGLQAFEQCSLIDDCILVVGKGEVSYARKEIVEKYGFKKISAITEGGAERFLSVEGALQIIRERRQAQPEEGYLFIHDGARPLVTEKIIEDTYYAAVTFGAVCAAMPVKDTIKVADEKGFAKATPDRSSLFAVQTPQVFETCVILEAYELLMQNLDRLNAAGIRITDDAMVVEQMLHKPVKLVESSYENIKITTPEDLEVATSFLSHRN